MAADEAFAGFGELIFSLLIGYLGALEFAFVARHLYHWTCRHPEGSNELVDAAADAEELPRLRERLDKQLVEAAEREAAAGGQNVMQDGVLYSNGFRVDKREALATELERQRRIEEETRQQLAEAEHKLAEERRKAEASRAEAEESARRQLEESERKREREEQERENERKLIEAEKQREAAQREREENERKLQEAESERMENERKLQEIERERKENERKLEEAESKRKENELRELQEIEREREENERKLREAEKQRELEEGERERQEAEEQREREENERKLKEAEEKRNEAQRKIEEEEAQTQAERQLLELDAEQAQRDAEIVERLLAAERERKLSATESELEEEALVLEQSRRLASSQAGMERKQKSIEENARLFMEAEEEMVMLQQRMLQAAREQEDAEYAGMVPVVEEPCVKKILPPRFEEPTIEEPLIVQRVKTQFGQTGSTEATPYARSKTLTFPGVSDEGSSVEPDSSQKSSFSTQLSEDRSHQMTEEERQEPEGEDYVPDVQYTEDYLRSLDGIKSRPLLREDGSGRRRAFKKRRSSGSSNSSRDSRASRDEELKMFTSLEEEELKHGEKADYNPIKYSTEPALRVKSHHRRHKRSPAKDVMPASDASGSLEMLGEEGTNPWGEVLPEPYKNTEFWKREKALSIDEEELDLERRASGEEVPDEAQITPKESSFEHATEEQNALAAHTLLQQRSKEQLDRERERELELQSESEPSGGDIKSNLQTSQATEEQSRGGSPGLRRSPRIDEMDHYEERWRESAAASHTASQSTPPPSIAVHQPDTAPWRDQYGLLMEGISDFYDFTASVNPSRSRSTSRNPSPQPRNVAHRMDVDEAHTLEVYDDSQEGLSPGELNCELVLQMLEATISDEAEQQLQLQNVADDLQNGSSQVLPMVYETPPPQAGDEQEHDNSSKLATNGYAEAHPEVDLPQPVIEINDMAEAASDSPEPMPTPEDMRLFVETMRAERANSRGRSQSRSRSRSPLPTADNIARSLESRRQKRIRHNDEIRDHLRDEQAAVSPTPVIPPLPTISIDVAEEEPVEEPEDTPESMARLFEQLRLNRCRSHSRSRSRSRSPLPSAANLEHSLQNRREKLIAQNDAFFEQLQQRVTTPEPESPTGRDMRSLSPSRSRSVSPGADIAAEQDFQLMLNLEGAENRTLRQHSAELEQMLANSAKQHDLDLEALQKLKHASEEVELRVDESEYPYDYERSFSEAVRDLKDELNVSGFKRSTYVGESVDMGSELEPNFKFQRSRTPSPSTSPTLDLFAAREQAAAQREMQAAILDSLISASGVENEKRLGAKPKTNEYSERSFSEELKDTQRMQEEALSGRFKRSTYVGESIDLGIAPQLDDLRHRTAEFQRSRSQSRSPMRDEQEAHALRNIDAEAAKREQQDQLLDQLAAASVNFQNFSRYLNTDFLDSERRASDSAIMQLDPYADLEPEEYHHFRRYSLAQEQPVEEYPSDECVYISQIEVRSLTGKRTWLKEDFYTHDLASLELDFDESSELLESSGKQQIGEGSWARAVLAAEAEAAEFDETSAIYKFDICGEQPGNEDAYSSNDSEDERQTVVGMDDDDDDDDADVDEYEFELDEGISDNNERTQPTDESHHDTSECEEAERNADRYANRGANDWEEVDNVEDFADYSLDDGAVGGGAYSDPDSFIEQIYNDAVKNRKQSGILREFETMVQEQLPAEGADQSESDKEKSGSDSERYALWAKTRALDRSEDSGSRHRDIDISLGLVEGERRDTEMRYLGDAQVAARQSARLRTRYGYSPKLPAGVVEDDIEVDLNYKPKREYNWRKNFKLDEDAGEDVPVEPQTSEDQLELLEQAEEQAEDQQQELDLYELPPSGELDLRRYSLGGESITLFSRSPERELLSVVAEETLPEQESGHMEAAAVDQEEAAPSEKTKKKKSKKKTRKGSKTEEELRDDNDSDNQEYKRRSSATRDDAENPTETPTKRKVRSRRSSKSSSANEEANGALFSPRNSVGLMPEAALEGIAELETPEDGALKKKTKKRKKSIKEQPAEPDIDVALAEALAKIAPVTLSASTNLTPASTQQNLLASLSAGHSLCLTPASSIEEPPGSDLAAATAAPARSVVDSFDILKDANFYPLF